MHPLDRFANLVESRRPRQTLKYCNPVHLSLIFLLVTSCQSMAPFQFLKKEVVYLEKMTPSNVSLINSNPEVYKYKDNNEYLPPIDLRKGPEVLEGI